MHLSKKKIELIMAQKEFSLTELAKRCGRTKQRISCILNTVNVSPKTGAMIAKALGVDVTEIIEQ